MWINKCMYNIFQWYQTTTKAYHERLYVNCYLQATVLACLRILLWRPTSLSSSADISLRDLWTFCMTSGTKLFPVEIEHLLSLRSVSHCLSDPVCLFHLVCFMPSALADCCPLWVTLRIYWTSEVTRSSTHPDSVSDGWSSAWSAKLKPSPPKNISVSPVRSRCQHHVTNQRQVYCHQGDELYQ